jgi:hypothetical protein
MILQGETGGDHDKSPQRTLTAQYSNWPPMAPGPRVAPHGILLSAALWLWRPNADKDGRKFDFVAA